MRAAPWAQGRTSVPTGQGTVPLPTTVSVADRTGSGISCRGMTGAVPEVPTSWRAVGAAPALNGPEAAVLFRSQGAMSVGG